MTSSIDDPKWAYSECRTSNPLPRIGYVTSFASCKNSGKLETDILVVLRALVAEGFDFKLPAVGDEASILENKPFVGENSMGQKLWVSGQEFTDEFGSRKHFGFKRHPRGILPEVADLLIIGSRIDPGAELVVLKNLGYEFDQLKHSKVSKQAITNEKYQLQITHGFEGGDCPKGDSVTETGILYKLFSEDETLVAKALLSFFCDIGRPGPCIEFVETRDSFRRRGIGRLLLEEIKYDLAERFTKSYPSVLPLHVTHAIKYDWSMQEMRATKTYREKMSPHIKKAISKSKAFFTTCGFFRWLDDDGGMNVLTRNGIYIPGMSEQDYQESIFHINLAFKVQKGKRARQRLPERLPPGYKLLEVGGTHTKACTECNRNTFEEDGYYVSDMKPYVSTEKICIHCADAWLYKKGVSEWSRFIF